MRAEEVLAAEGWTLPSAHPVVANYRLAVQAGSLMFVSGHGPFLDGRPAHTGKLGASLTVEEGREAARIAILNILGTLKSELGRLSRVSRFVKLLVMVNATADFTEHHLVADGATDVLAKVFGKNGTPARTAVGMASLPLDLAVEIEAIVQVGD